MPSEKADSDPTFPVDTLGIPILVDVVESTAAPEPEDALEILVENGGTAPEPPDLQQILDEELPYEVATKIDLGQAIDKIVDSVTEEIMAALEPLIRDKVNLALQMYENELLQIPDEENEKKPGPD